MGGKGRPVRVGGAQRGRRPPARGIHPQGMRRDTERGKDRCLTAIDGRREDRPPVEITPSNPLFLARILPRLGRPPGGGIPPHPVLPHAPRVAATRRPGARRAHHPASARVRAARPRGPGVGAATTGEPRTTWWVPPARQVRDGCGAPNTKMAHAKPLQTMKQSA